MQHIKELAKMIKDICAFAAIATFLTMLGVVLL